jgi:hypothetical protein
VIGLDALRENAARTRRQIESSLSTKGVRGAMSEFFAAIRHASTMPAPELRDPRHDAGDVRASRRS